jgi:hypothetical protein
MSLSTLEVNNDPLFSNINGNLLSSFNVGGPNGAVIATDQNIPPYDVPDRIDIGIAPPGGAVARHIKVGTKGLIPSGTNYNGDAPNFIDLKARAASIHFSFVGGTNITLVTGSRQAGSYGLCVQSAGNLAAGKLYYDLDGGSNTGVLINDWDLHSTGLYEVPLYDGSMIVTVDAITNASPNTGVTLQLAANSFYQYNGTIWVAKGGSTSSTTGMQCIKKSIVFNGGIQTSTNSIPSGSLISRVVFEIVTPFTSSSNILIAVGDDTLMSSGQLEFDETSPAYYQFEKNLLKTLDNSAVLTCSCDNHGAGAANVYVYFLTPLT